MTPVRWHSPPLVDFSSGVFIRSLRIVERDPFWPLEQCDLSWRAVEA